MVHCAQLVAVLKVNGKVMREHRESGSDIVYLPFGSEYEIVFNNLSPNRAAVRVEIDSKDALAGHTLVIDANGEGTLRGFMEANGQIAKNSFKFIKMTDRIAEHRGTTARDGLIRIEWQFEKPYEPPYYPQPITPVRPWRKAKPFYPPSNPWYDTPLCSSGGSDFSCSVGSDSVGEVQTSGVLRSAGFNKSSDSYANSDKGITAAGSVVNQGFSTTYLRELFPEKHVVVFELRGETGQGKPIVVARAVKTKVQCENCGKRNKSSSKHCVECGTCLV